METVHQIHCENTVIAKFMDDHPPSVSQVQHIVTHAWPMRDQIKVSRMGDIFLFRCFDEDDKSDLIHLENVSIMGALLVFKPFVPPYEHHFSETAFWVRIHGVPPAQIGREVGMGLGGIMGRALDVDLKQKGVIRVKVRIDLKLPIVLGAFFDAGEEEEEEEEGGLVWVGFGYENVVKVCKKCRRLDHLSRRCPVALEVNNVKSPFFSVLNLKGA